MLADALGIHDEAIAGGHELLAVGEKRIKVQADTDKAFADLRTAKGPKGSKADSARDTTGLTTQPDVPDEEAEDGAEAVDPDLQTVIDKLVEDEYLSKEQADKLALSAKASK